MKSGGHPTKFGGTPKVRQLWWKCPMDFRKVWESPDMISGAWELIRTYVRTVGNTTEDISRNRGKVKDYFGTNPK
jgi:hypothetical protein